MSTFPVAGLAATLRSLAVATTGERVVRERLLPGAVLTRIAASHLRIGTFEWAAAHHDPAHCAPSPTTDAISERQAALEEGGTSARRRRHFVNNAG